MTPSPQTDRFKPLIQKARRTNAKRDQLDRESGLAAPADVSTDALLRTVLSALECGISMRDWDNVAEAYVMLEDHMRSDKANKIKPPSGGPRP